MNNTDLKSLSELKLKSLGKRDHKYNKGVKIIQYVTQDDKGNGGEKEK